METTASPQVRKRGRHKLDCPCQWCANVARQRAQAPKHGPAGIPTPPPPERPVTLARVQKQADEFSKAAFTTDPTALIADTDFRSRVGQIALLKQQGLTTKETAEKLGLSPQTVASYISKGRKLGILQLYSPADIVEFEIAPKVVDNIVHFLDAKSEKMTIEAAKGIGIFKSHQAVKIDGDVSKTNLIVNIQFQDSGEVREAGHVVGTPKVIDITPTKVE